MKVRLHISCPCETEARFEDTGPTKVITVELDAIPRVGEEIWPSDEDRLMVREVWHELREKVTAMVWCIDCKPEMPLAVNRTESEAEETLGRIIDSIKSAKKKAMKRKP